MSKSVCIICGSLFVEGIGFVEKHYFPCRNNSYGENWTKLVEDNWRRPGGNIDPGGIWNNWIDTEKDIIEYRYKHSIFEC